MLEGVEIILGENIQALLYVWRKSKESSKSKIILDIFSCSMLEK